MWRGTKQTIYLTKLEYKKAAFLGRLQVGGMENLSGRMALTVYGRHFAMHSSKLSIPTQTESNRLKVFSLRKDQALCRATGG